MVKTFSGSQPYFTPSSRTYFTAVATSRSSRKARRGNGIAHDNGVHADGIEAHGDGLGFTVGRKGVRAARADDDGGTLFYGNLF